MKINVVCFIGLALAMGNSAWGKPVETQESRFKHLEMFNKALYLIESQYVKPVDTSILIEGAIKGMLETLDPYSNYLSKQMMERMNSDIAGHYAGIGIDIIQKDGVVIVITPIINSPAYKAGIKPGDQIIEIDSSPIFGMSLNDIDGLIQGKNGTKVNLGISRLGKSKLQNISVTRGDIPIESASYEIINEANLGSIGFIRLTTFQKGSHLEISKMLKKIKKEAKDLKGLILDVRSNPGGLLEEAIEISSLFLSDGVVVSTKGRDALEKDVQYVTKKNEKELDLPMVVLINGASASASEIVAGALRDHKRALIMGSTSFGKASVQTIAKLSDSQGIKLTVAQYITPNGHLIHGKGITPDIPISELDSEWVQEHSQVVPFIHVSDVVGPINAIVETQEEKKERKERMLERRIRLLKSIAANKERMKNRLQKNQQEMVFIPYDAKKDYQVAMASKFLRSFEIYKMFYENMRK